MGAKANYFKIGLFVLTAAAIAIAAITVLGAGRLFQRRIMVETYINESVQGLDVGSAVRYRGVQIGNIKDIDFVHNQYDLSPDQEIRYVLIRIQLRPAPFGATGRKDIGAILEKEIGRGLRVRMSAQGLTGSYYLEVDYMDPERNPPLKITWQPLYFYIPSATSTISRMSESLDAILRKVEATDFELVAGDLHGLLSSLKREVEDARIADIHGEITAFLQETGGQVRDARLGKLHDEVSAVLKGLDESNQALQAVLKDPKIAEILTGASETVSGARDLVKNNEGKVAEILAVLADASGKLDQTAEKLNALVQSEDVAGSFEHLNATLRRLDMIIARQEGSIDAIFENVSRASKDLQELIREARKYPSGFLFGEPPPRPTREGK